MPSEDIVGLLPVMFIFLVTFAGMFIVIKKRWINKKPTIYSAQFTAQNIYMQFQNRQKKNATEHVQYQKEEKKQNSDGDDINRFSQSMDEEISG